jgi:hypothetical protein
MLHPTVVVRARGGVGTASRERRTRRRRAGRQGQPRSADGGRRVLLPYVHGFGHSVIGGLHSAPTY